MIGDKIKNIWTILSSNALDNSSHGLPPVILRGGSFLLILIIGFFIGVISIHHIVYPQFVLIPIHDLPRYTFTQDKTIYQVMVRGSENQYIIDYRGK